jgi:drug/metabolite transporter (DMT)-like permease
MAIFGSATPVSKLVTDSFPVFVGASLRMAVAALVLLPWVITRPKQRKALKQAGRRDWLALGGIALVGMFGFTLFMLYGMRLVSGVVGSIVMSTTPAITAVASAVFFRDPFGWRKVGGIGLSVLGLLVLNAGGLGDAGAYRWELLWGILLVLAAVCCEAAYTLLGKLATRKLSPLAIAGVTGAGALLLFAGPGVYQALHLDWSRFSVSEWLAVAWWGAGTLALGSVLWYSGVSRVSGSTAAGFMGVMPVSALVLSYVLLGEPFRWLHLAGFAVVFVGVLLIGWAHARHAKAEAEA